MKKNTLIVIGISFAIIVGGTIFLLTSSPKIQSYQKESLIVERDLVPIELSPEEQQALQDEGLQVLSEEDALAKELQNVRSSDEINAIEADLNETNLLGLDSELEAIDSDLQGL